MSARPHGGPSRLARVVLASAVSELGDWFTYIAMTVLAATSRSGERPFALAAVVLSQTLPRAALAPFAGVLIDRFDRRSLAVVSMLVRGALVFAMAVAAYTRHLDALLVVHVMRMGLASVSEGAVRAGMPRWLEARDLVRANRVLSALWSLWLALGLLAGGAVTALVSPVAALAVDACSFVLAAGVLATLPAVPLLEKPLEAQQTERASLRASGAANPVLWRAALSRGPLALAAGGGFVALGLRAGQTPSAAATTLTLTSVLLSRAAGNALGAVWATRTARHLAPRLRTSLLVAALTGLAGLACFSRVVPTPVALVAALLWGFGLGAQWNLVSLALQTESPDAVLGRWISLDVFAFTVAQGSGGLLVAAVTEAHRPHLALPATLALALLLVLAWWRLTR